MKRSLLKSICLSLVGFLGAGLLSGIINFANKEALQVHAADSTTIGENADTKYGIAYSKIQTKRAIGNSQSCTAGSTTVKTVTWSWSGGTTGTNSTSLYIASGGTFTISATGIENVDGHLLYGRIMMAGDFGYNATLTVSQGSKSTSITTNSGYTNIQWYPELIGGSGGVVTWSIKNNGSSAAHIRSGYVEAFVAKQYTVTLNKSGGTGGDSSTTTYHYQSYGSINMPTKSGYRCTGYFDASSGGTKYYNGNGTAAKTAWDLGTGDLSSGLTLYAQWEIAEQAVNVTAGTGVSGVYLSTNQNATSGSASGTKFNSGSTVYAFATLAKGYKAKSGWVKVSGTADTEGAKYRVSSQTVGTSTVNFGTISADLITYTITYNGLSGASVSGNPSSYNVTSAAFTLNNPTKTGYTFVGWSGTGISGTSKSVTVASGSIGNRTYTAAFNANTYQVTLNKADGQGDPENLSINYDAYFADLTTLPTKDSDAEHSYSFGGYFTALNGGGTQYIDEFGKGCAPWKETSDKTLYAYFTIDMTVSSQGWSGKWVPNSDDPTQGVKRGITINVESPEETTIYYGTSAGACNDTNAENYLYDIAGEYEVFFEVRKAGYTTYRGSQIVSIEKEATIVAPTPVANTLEYTGQSQALVVAGEADYGEMRYALSTSNELPADSQFTYTNSNLPKAANVGTYYVFYKTTGDANHHPYASSVDHVVTIQIDRVDRTEIENLNQIVLDYLDTINEKYPTIAGILENVRQEVHQDAIVEDNINTQGVAENVIKLQEALSAAKVSVTEALIQAIGDVKYPTSGDDIAAAHDYFNDVLNEDEQALVDSALKETLTHDKSVYDAVDEVANKIDDIVTPAPSEQYYVSVADAKSAYEALDSEQKAILDAASDKDYEVLLDDNINASKVVKLIEDIGNLSYNGGDDDSLEDIVAAEEAYALLSDAQKALVNEANHEALTDSRESYDEVQQTIALIDAIGDIHHGGDNDSKEALDDARVAYDALSEAEKALVKGYHNSYQTLDDHEHVYEALVLIDAIGEVSYDTDSDERIAEARAYYDTLSDEQKLQLGEAPHALLTQAEDSYASKKQTATVWNIILFIIVGILLVLGILVMIKLLKQKKEEHSGAPAKAMSVAPILPLSLLVSNLLSTPFVVLYILIGLTVAVWLADLVIYLIKKYYKPKPKASTVNEEEEEVETVTDEHGNTFQIRYIKSFMAKLIQSPEQTKKYYEELKNEVLSYQKANSRISWHYDAINAGREYVLKFAIRGKTLCVYLALNAEDYADSKYKVEAVESKKFEDTPCLYRIKNDRRLGYAKDLIAVIMARLGLSKGEQKREIYADLPYEPNKPLIERGLIKELKILINKPADPEVPANEEEEEVETVTDEHGNTFQIRYIKSFMAKLIQSPEATKKYYEELKNEVLSYKKAKSRISWHYDAINAGREYVLKFAIRGKTLCVYLALNAEDYADSKYKVEAVESKKFEDTPCLYRIKNDRRLGYAKDLIAVIMARLGLSKGEQKHEIYADLPYEPNKPLIERGLIKELRIQINKPAEPEVPANEEEEEEVKVITDERGNTFQIRYIKSFTAKLSQSPDLTKSYYEELKNYVLSYKGVHSRVSWHYDAVNVGRNQVLKFAVRGKTLCVYLALNADDYADSKYKVEAVESKKFEDTPCLYRIKNDRRLGYAKDLIDEVMRRLSVIQNILIPQEDYKIPYETTEALLAKGLIKEMKVALNQPAPEAPVSEEEEEEVLVKDDKGNLFRIQYERSFTAKMCQSSDELKAYYRQIKNHVLSYKKANSRISWGFDSINLGREKILKFAVRGKTLCVYLALNPDDLADSKYKVEKVESKKYEDVPCLYRIKNDRRCNYAKQLIDMIMERIGAVLGEAKDDDYPFPYESTEALLEKGLIKEHKRSL